MNATATVACDVKDLALADIGKRRIEWAFQSMPVLQTIRKQFIKTQPLAEYPRGGVPARHHRNRQPDDHPARRRRQHRAVRFEPLVHAG